MGPKPLSETPGGLNREMRRRMRYRTPRHAFDRVFGGIVPRPTRSILAARALRLRG